MNQRRAALRSLTHFLTVRGDELRDEDQAFVGLVLDSVRLDRPLSESDIARISAIRAQFARQVRAA